MSTLTTNGSPPDLHERLQDPETALALDHILERLEALARVADMVALASEQLPGGIAMAVDSADEIAGRLTAEGVDIGRGVANGTEAALRFGAIMGRDQVASIEALLRSGVLDPGTLRLMGRLGDALSGTAASMPARMGVLDAWRSLRDPDVQRALGFLIGFAKRFGTALAAPG